MRAAGRSRGGVRRWVALLALPLSFLACTGDDDDDSPDDSSPAESTTTLSPEAEVEAAYLAFWEMFVRLAQAPDPTDPEISQRASGDALRNLIEGLTDLQTLNRRSEFGPDYEHRVLSVELTSDNTAVVKDCAVDDSRIVDVSNGETVEQATVTELSEVTLLLRDTRWLVDHSRRLNAWEGAVECQ